MAVSGTKGVGKDPVGAFGTGNGSPGGNALNKTKPQGGFSRQNGAPGRIFYAKRSPGRIFYQNGARADSLSKMEPGAVGRSIFLDFLVRTPRGVENYLAIGA